MKKYLDLIINIGFLFILNITLTWTIYHDIEFLNIIFYLLESLFFGSLIKLISNLFQKQFLRRFINLATLVLITIIYASQFVYYSFYESFYSVYSLFHGSQVFGFLEAILKVIFENIYGFSFFMILLVVIVVVYLKVPLENFKKKNIIAIGITVLSLCINLLLANVLTSGLYSYHNLLHNTHNVALNVKKFGLLTSTFIDAKRYIFGFEPSLINENSNNSKEYTSKDYNITDINFTKIIEKEEDVNIKDLSKYLEEKTPTKKNDYTGIFQGKNLIFITAESFDFSLIDKSADLVLKGRLAPDFSDKLGYLSIINPINIVDNASELNIIAAKNFANYTQIATEEDIDSIPSLIDDKSDRYSPKFQVLLHGDMRKPLKMIRTFQWLALESDIENAQKYVDLMPTPEVGEEHLSVDELIKKRAEQAANQQVKEESTPVDVESQEIESDNDKTFGNKIKKIFKKDNPEK